MRWRIVRTIFVKEVVETLRDRRSLFMLVALPALVYPLMLIGLTKVATTQAESRERQASRVAVWGTLSSAMEAAVGRERVGAPPEGDQADARPPAVTLVTWAGCPAAIASALEAGTLAPPPEAKRSAAPRGPQVRLGPREQVAQEEDPIAVAARAAIARKEVHAAVVPDRDLAARLERGELARVVIYHDSVDEESRHASERVERALEAWRRGLVAGRVKELGLPAGYETGVQVAARTVAPASRRSGQRLGSLLPFILIVMSLMGGFYASIDLTAGEKERGTMQTLLCAPLDPREVIGGKFMAVWIMTVLAGAANVASIAATLWRILPEDQLEISPAALALTMLLFVPVSFTTSACFLAVGAFARDFKDGQNFITPLYLALAIPSGFTMLPGVELSAWTAFVPVLNIALLIKAVLLGEADPQLVFLTLASSALYGALALLFAARVFTREQVLLGGKEPLLETLGLSSRGGGAPTPGLAVGLFAVVLVTMFYGSLLLERRGPLAMLLGTQVGLMLSPALLATAALRLSPRRTLALRPPSPRGLLAAALLGVSAWTFAAGVLVRFVPPPDDLVKALERATLLSDPATPLAVALLVMALVPAACEELLFRGFILSGLRSLGPRAAIGVTALLFGLAHASVHRLLPTTFLGLVLGLVAWRTGSIACCILVHALNNGVAAVLVRTPWLAKAVGADDKVLPAWLTAAGLVVLCAGLLVLRGCRPVDDPAERAGDRGR